MMIKVNNDKEYHESLLHTSLLILAAALIMIFLKPLSWVGVIVFTVIIELIFLSQSFTDSVSVDDTKVTIVSYCFFSRNVIIINKSEASSKLSKAPSFRGSAYWVLDIMQHNKKVYGIESRDGFSEKDLVMLNSLISRWAFVTVVANGSSWMIVSKN